MKSRSRTLSAFDSFNIGFMAASTAYLLLIGFCALSTYSMLVAFISAGAISNCFGCFLMLCFGAHRFNADSFGTGYTVAQLLLLFVTTLLIGVYIFMPEPDNAPEK